ncbi:hypothetical protein [Novosphingobium sp. HII-3]|uniref:hypothetical protein n=1 Tax=Novosphingobium sp. HII-3 TaxID=2075565 RepID=UPI000CDA67DC|nr:hypothetical protein [Novosphingobium sp. HII-3]
MLTFFRIVDTQTQLRSKPAPLNARELARLRSILQYNSVVTEPEAGETEGTAYNFEANANAVALAKFAGLFTERLDVLAILEEAQFLGRAIRVSRAAPNTDAILQVSEHITLTPEIAVTSEQADHVLDCLGLDNHVTEGIPLSTLRSTLANPATYHRFERGNLTTTYEYLERLSYTDCGDQAPHLSWA